MNKKRIEDSLEELLEQIMEEMNLDKQAALKLIEKCLYKI
jgi:hypothetical protein